MSEKFCIQDPWTCDLINQTSVVEEAGIRFKGDVIIDENVSVITVPKEIKVENRKEAVKTYLKVLEVRELVEEEMEIANKGLLIVKRMFNILFKKSDKINLNLVLYITLELLNIYTGNVFLMIFWAASIVLELGSRKALKYVKSCLMLEKNKQELEELNLLTPIYEVNNVNDIEMYFIKK